MGIICQTSYNGKIVVYCIDHTDGEWYIYTDNKCQKEVRMHINDIPIILIYQIKSTIKYNYKPILVKREKKIKLKVLFNAGLGQKQLFFYKDETIGLLKSNTKLF